MDNCLLWPGSSIFRVTISTGRLPDASIRPRIYRNWHADRNTFPGTGSSVQYYSVQGHCLDYDTSLQLYGHYSRWTSRLRKVLQLLTFPGDVPVLSSTPQPALDSPFAQQMGLTVPRRESKPATTSSHAACMRPIGLFRRRRTLQPSTIGWP